jgi:hypothetical protein
MRKGTLLTSFIVDEITAQARYRNLLDGAAQRRLVQLAHAHRPSWPARVWRTFEGRLINWRRRVKEQAMPIEVRQ